MRPTAISPVRARRTLTAVAGMVLAAMLGSACSSSAGSAAPPPSSATGRVGSAPPTTSAVDAGQAGALQAAFVSVLAKVRPEVVEISTPSGLGSGVIYDAAGDIVTNDHVVGDSTSFQVHLYTGQSLTASLVGAYPPDDLAVVRVKGAKNLAPATFADSSSLAVGDIVFAIGNPLGLASSVTEGIVSATGREAPEGNGVVLPSTIQTSAAINPGNSGGGLVDLAGQVVGIPTLAALDPETGGSAAPGIGFAIPSNTVKMIAAQLVSSGRVSRSGRAALGIQAADAVGPDGSPIGVLVEGEAPGGPAAKAGIPVGVAITAVNGTQTPTLSDLADVLAGLVPGQRAQVTYLAQDGSTHTVAVTLGELTS